MNEVVKRRSLLILHALNNSADECEQLAEEVVAMLIRGDDNRRIAPQVRADVDNIRRAVEDIKNSIVNVEIYVNRRQETHRL